MQHDIHLTAKSRCKQQSPCTVFQIPPQAAASCCDGSYPYFIPLQLQRKFPPDCPGCGTLLQLPLAFFNQKLYIFWNRLSLAAKIT